MAGDGEHISGYDPELSQAILGETAHLLRHLGFAANHAVLIGGLVPGLLVLDPGPSRPVHVGTTDIDICLSVATWGLSSATRRRPALPPRRGGPPGRRRPSGAELSKASRWSAASRSTDPERTLRRARANLRRLRAAHPRGVAARWLGECARLLDGPVDELLEAMTSRSERGCELRQNSPFAGVLTQRERGRILANLQDLAT